MRNSPCALDMAWRSKEVCSERATIFADGMRAPLGSATSPTMLPRKSCGWDNGENRSGIKTQMTMRNILSAYGPSGRVEEGRITSPGRVRCAAQGELRRRFAGVIGNGRDFQQSGHLLLPILPEPTLYSHRRWNWNFQILRPAGKRREKFLASVALYASKTS